MQVKRYAEARPYHAPLHHGMTALRLQGIDATAADFAWVGMSMILPGGGADMDAGALGKIYVVLAGEITVTLRDGTRTTLRALDSCFIAAGEARAVANETNDVSRMLVIMPTAARAP